MKNDNYYMQFAQTIAKEATCGAVLVNDAGSICAHSNKDGQYAYIKCVYCDCIDPQGSTLYLTHGVNSRNAMKIVDTGVKRVVFVDEFGTGVGTALLRAMGVEVTQHV